MKHIDVLLDQLLLQREGSIPEALRTEDVEDKPVWELTKNKLKKDVSWLNGRYRKRLRDLRNQQADAAMKKHAPPGNRGSPWLRNGLVPSSHMSG